jgi:hypothetical protein
MDADKEDRLCTLFGLSEQEFESLIHSLRAKLLSGKADKAFWSDFWKWVRAKKGKDHDAAVFLGAMYMFQTRSIYPDMGAV